MVPDAHRDAARIEELAHIVRVHALDVEGPQPDALGAGGVAQQADARDAAETLAHARLEGALVPTFAQCLPPNVQLAFPPDVLRDASVLAYARLAFANEGQDRR